MKKLIFLTAAVVMVAVGANAQDFSKGDWFLNAQTSSLGLEHSFVDDLSTTTFDLGVGGGYFLSNKFAIDALVGFDLVKVKDVDGVSAFNIGAGVRYYPVSNLFAKVGYKGVNASAGGKSAWTSYLGASVGYDFFFNDRVFFEPAVYYQKNLADGGENVLGLSLGLGIKF